MLTADQSDLNGKIAALVIDAAKLLNASLDREIDLSRGREANVFGANGVLDSLALVSFIVLLEEQIEDRFGVPIILASERAMSQRHSPFATIGTFADYITGLVSEESRGELV